jgi:hypothetical protein
MNRPGVRRAVCAGWQARAAKVGQPTRSMDISAM